MAVKVEAIKSASMFMGDNWCARCSTCKKILTKYCETKEQAISEAESETCCPDFELIDPSTSTQEVEKCDQREGSNRG